MENDLVNNYTINETKKRFRLPLQNHSGNDRVVLGCASSFSFSVWNFGLSLAIINVVDLVRVFSGTVTSVSQSVLINKTLTSC